MRRDEKRTARMVSRVVWNREHMSGKGRSEAGGMEWRGLASWRMTGALA
jgi:hypothetical protein